MIKDFKSIEHWPFFRQLADFGERLSPNFITTVGFIATLASAVLAYHQEFALAGITTLVHLICDGLDGYVARRFGKSTEVGFLLDHIFDRLSDLLLFPVIGIAVNAFLPGLLVAIACLFSSYIGVLNKAVGAPQDKGGLFAKTYRYQLLIIVLFLFHFLPDLRTVLFNYFCYGSLIIGLATIGTRTKALFQTVISKGEGL